MFHTEREFQAALDATPDDSTLRLVFADWLEEKGDPRAEGYRAMQADIRFRPMHTPRGAVVFSDRAAAEKSLPEDWFDLLECKVSYRAFSVTHDKFNLHKWRDYASWSEAEDDLARAFSRLPAERRAELLSPASAPAPA